MQTILLTIITALISSYLTYYFAIKSKRDEIILKFKEEKYTQLLILLQGFVEGTASEKIKRQFFEQHYQSWLYCSDGVTKAINDLITLLDSKREGPYHIGGGDVLGNIAFEMRKDLLGKTKLKPKDFRYISIIK